MKSFLLVIMSAVIALSAVAQIPQKMSYQAIIRDSDDKLIVSQQIGIQIRILSGNDEATATQVYTETQTPTTNANGLLSIEFGGNSGWENIDWSTGNYFIKSEVDPSGGSNYTISGASKLLSVPYAFFAQTAGNSGSSATASIVFTNEANMVTTTSAKTGGNVVGGSSAITERGVCWSTEQNPTVNDSKTTEGEGFGYFTSELSELSPGATYYIRAYATSSMGTSYGNQVSFKTFLNVVFPTVTTEAAINITETSAASGGNVTETGGAEIIVKGVCWSTNKNPTIANSKTEDGNEAGLYKSQLDNLSPGSTYYIRAYATNSAGTGYGAEVALTTLKTAPVVITKNIASITPMGGVSGGTIALTGGGTISDKGICWGEAENPTIYDNKLSAGTGNATFNSAISMLKPNTTTYVRAYAVNEIGISYGEQKTFTTTDAFYDGFETGFSGNTGGWGIVMGSAMEGAYFLQTTINGAEASLTRTLASQGQFSFYAKISNYYWSRTSIKFYIDNVERGTYSNTFWGLQTYPVTEGEHTFKWKFTTGNGYTGWIDFIVVPK